MLRKVWRIVWQLTVVALLYASSGAADEARLFPDYCDSDTAALWLFDDPIDPPASPRPSVTPWYYTQTITDASRNYYDLHRLHGGAIENGRFGRALRVRGNEVGPDMQLATNYASEPRVYGVFLPADHEFVPGSPKEQESVVNYFWYTSSPDHILSAVAGDEWTAEMWVRLAKAPGESVCLLDSGQGTQTSLRVDLVENGAKCLVSVPAAGVVAECDLGNSNISDGQWHHLAFVKPAGKSELLTYFGGHPVSSSEFSNRHATTAPALQPGLVARFFNKLDFDDAARSTTLTNLQGDMESASQDAKSVRLRGWIKAPATGAVRFETDADSGLHLDVNHRPLTYGWFGRAAIYRRSPRWGTVEMKRGEWYPVLVDMQHGADDKPFRDQRLYWSWNGGPKQEIPATAWAHSEQDLSDSDSDNGGGFAPSALLKTRFNLTLGSDRQGQHAIDGWLDEVRVSSTARYNKSFTPKTHSLGYGPDAPPVARPSGPPLLFTGANSPDPLPLGTRRHLFLDDALLDKTDGLDFVVNSPEAPKTLEPLLPFGDHSFFELEGDVALFAPAGYEGREDYAHLWVSKDGVHFNLHDAHTPVGGGDKPSPIRTDVPAWGRMAIDNNPSAPDWARFKYTAGVPHRGIYLLVSPDAVHWRRNETIMLQVGTGGESHWYWDDQTGDYRYLLKWDHGPGGRQSVEAATNECFEPWPLAEEGDSTKDLATPLGYMPSRFPPDEALGEVYRSRGVKYAWAPDAYVAFLWRFDPETQARQVELAVSRDGTRWTHYGNQWYMPAEFVYEGQQIHEVTSVDGMIRRGDEIWQYADYSTGRHDGSKPRWRVRLTQRLDGFVSLDAEDQGEFMTKPFTFAGNQLKLNASVASGGEIQLALVDVDGSALPGFSFDDCEPIHSDSTSLEVKWKSGRHLSELDNKPVRLQGRMKQAKLYALQFE